MLNDISEDSSTINLENIIRLVKHSIIVILPAYFIVGLILFIAIILWQWKGIPIGNLTRDPSNILEFPFYYGAISYFGIILWTATATLCLYTGIVCRHASNDNRISTFLLASGIFTAALMFDDLFLFHEKFFPNYLNIPEIIVYSGYAITGICFLVFFRKQILRTEFPLLFAAGILLSISMMADRFTNQAADTSIKFLTEDGFKLFGIMSWFVYYLRLCIAEGLARINKD